MKHLLVCIYLISACSRASEDNCTAKLQRSTTNSVYTTSGCTYMQSIPINFTIYLNRKLTVNDLKIFGTSLPRERLIRKESDKDIITLDLPSEFYSEYNNTIYLSIGGVGPTEQLPSSVFIYIYAVD